MASHQTTNFQLCQWEAEDEVLRTDFNSDNLKIENALSAIKTVADKAYTTDSAPVVCGWYQGNDAPQRKIELGFTPRAVFICTQTGMITNSQVYGGLAVEGHALSRDALDYAQWTAGKTALAVCENGFYVGYDLDADIRTNQSNTIFFYLSFR